MNARLLPHAAALVIAVGLPSSAFAFTECTRSVKNIFLGLTPSDQRTYVTFTDAGAPIYKSESQLTSGQMARFTAMAVAAQTTGRQLIVRYPEDGLVCPTSGTARSDADGIWLRPD